MWTKKLVGAYMATMIFLFGQFYAKKYRGGRAKQPMKRAA